MDTIFYLLILITVYSLSAYIILHTVSYVLTVLASTKKRKLILRNKYMLKDYLNNLIVVVYCHNQEKAATYMLEALNRQDYPKQNCQFHFILDNCTDNSANMLEFIGGAKIWKVGDEVTLGKNESVSWLLERLILVKNTDAFVFLDLERQIETDFLSSLNKSLITNDIVVGESEVVLEDNNTFSTYISTMNNYKNRIINTGRTLLGLSTFVDINCFAIKHNILEQIKFVDFKNTMSPYSYTLLLAKHKFFCYFDPNIKTKMPLQQYVDMSETFKHKFKLFIKNIFSAIKTKNFKATELTMHLITPSAFGIMLVLAIMLAYTYYFEFVFDTPVFLISGACILGAFLLSLLIGQFPLKNIALIASSFALKPWFKFLDLDFVSNIVKVAKREKVAPVIKTATRPVVVTDGKTNLTCELDLINEDVMAKAVLKYKRKKYSSEYYLRMYDAINDIVSTLNEHGFRVKICASCGYFQSLIDGTTNMIKGTCSKCCVANAEQSPTEVLLWSGCENYIPQEVHKVVDLASFRDK